MDGDDCPALDFLQSGEESQAAWRLGLLKMLAHIAQYGFEKMPAAWSHEANKQGGVFEFRRGSLRLFYFKGADGQIAVCTSGVLKKGQKADKRAVSRAVALRAAYFEAQKAGKLETEREKGDGT